jgi:hypothetical protein
MEVMIETYEEALEAFGATKRRQARREDFMLAE